MHMRAKSMCNFQIFYRPRTAVIYGRCDSSSCALTWDDLPSHPYHYCCSSSHSESAPTYMYVPVHQKHAVLAWQNHLTEIAITTSQHAHTIAWIIFVKLRVRFHIIRNARIENTGKYQPCMVSKLRIIWKQTVRDFDLMG